MSSIASKYKQLIGSAKEIAMEKSQQAAKKISLAKQMMKEGAGQVEDISENPVISENFEKVELTRDQVKNLYKLMKDVVNTGRANIQSSRQFANALIEMGEKFESDSQSFGDSMKRIGNYLLMIETAKEDLMASLESGFTNPMETFVKTDIKNAIASKKENYDSIRMAYDAEKTRQKSKTDQSHDAAFQAMQEKFEDAEIDTIDLLREVNERREVDTLASACEVVDAQVTLFKTCYDQIETMSTFTNDLHRTIDVKRKEFEKDKNTREAERRQRLKDKEPIPFATKYYGVPLLRILKRENRKGNEVPIVIQSFLTFIEEKGIQEEGIFRVSGTLSQIERLKNEYERGRPVEINDVDPHAIAGLLKMFLRELPEPLLTYGLYKKFISLKVDDGVEDVEPVIDLLHELPQANYVLLSKLMELLHKTNKLSQTNKMGPANLATVFGPNLLRTKDLSEGGFADNTAISKLVKYMVEFYEPLFLSRPMAITQENYDWFVEDIPAQPSATAQAAAHVQQPNSSSGSTRSKTAVFFTRQASDLPGVRPNTVAGRSTPKTDEDFGFEKSANSIPMSSFDSKSGPSSQGRSGSVMNTSTPTSASSTFGGPQSVPTGSLIDFDTQDSDSSFDRRSTLSN